MKLDRLSGLWRRPLLATLPLLVLVACGGPSRQSVTAALSPTPGTGPWNMLGPNMKMTSQPTLMPFGDQLALWVSGPDHELEVTFRYNGTWGTWRNFGGSLAGRPAAVGSSGYHNGTGTVFVRGSDGALWMLANNGFGPWGGWQSLGGALGGDPIATALGDGRVVVVVTRTDGQLFYRVGTLGSYAAFTDWQPFGQYKLLNFPPPAIASFGDGRAVLAYLAGGNIHTFEFDGRQWTAPLDLGSAPFASQTPGIAVLAPGHYAITAVGVDAHVYVQTVAPIFQRNWQPLGGAVYQLDRTSSTVAAYRAGNRIDVFAQDVNLGLFHGGFANGTTLGWDKLASCVLPASTPAVNVAGDGTIDLAVLDSDQLVYYASYPVSPSALGNYDPICNAGGLSRPCRGQPDNKCDYGQLCGPNGVCIACGSEGLACCPTGEGGCYPSLGCDDNRRCVTCGMAEGQPCCPGGVCLASGTTCARDAHSVAICQPTTSGGGGGTHGGGGKTCSGAAQKGTFNLFAIGIADVNHCAITQTSYYANSILEASTCAHRDYPGDRIVTNGQAEAFDFQWEHIDGAGCTPLQVIAFSSDDAQSCADSECGNCTFTPGHCPP